MRRAERPALVLTGGPAVGKSTCARALAARLQRCAVVDVDDLRQLILSGAVPPWQGAEGIRQHHLGVTNACLLTRCFRGAGFEVVISDVLTPQVTPIYRRDLPGCLIVHLKASLAQARARASTRGVHLTDEEFEALHRRDVDQPPAADLALEVGRLSLEEQIDAIDRVWNFTPS
jgi:gluconate kinase